MTWNDIDWAALERLRAAFLTGKGNYWRTESDLASYDLTFAARIGWKWNHVLRELHQLGWSPAPGTVLDYGCGTGIAARKMVEHFGVNDVTLWDESPLASRFAEDRLRCSGASVKRRSFPDPEQPAADTAAATPTTLLLSHVVTELDDRELDDLCTLAGNATAVIAVEPGTNAASRRLIEVRERLRGQFQIVAPCTHQGACGIVGSRHWCHHFATPPREVFRDGNWARFAKLAGVDLRSLPLSYLVLDKRPLPVAGNVRLIGASRLHKGYALVLGCDADGVADRRVTQRKLPAVYRQARKGELATRQWWRCDGTEVVEIKTP
jgi:ribosomal protein RSM22 (predicted rRNA methylase)